MGPPPEEELTRLERHFYRNARKGIVLNKRELRSYCDRYGIEADDSQLTSLKRKWVFSAIFTRPRGVSAHMGMMLPRYGSTMIDLAQMGTRKTRVGGRAPPSGRTSGELFSSRG